MWIRFLKIEMVMITLGSISREQAAEAFGFLAKKYPGRRKAIKEFTHRDPDFVFWIFPNGDLFDARDSHKKNVPKGYAHIVDDEPDYGGFLRGRVASLGGDQLIVVYCREDALATQKDKISQFLSGVEKIPVPVKANALVVSDNADIYGTLGDIRQRL